MVANIKNIHQGTGGAGAEGAGQLMAAGRRTEQKTVQELAGVETDDATRQVVKVRQHVAGLSLRAGRSKEGGDHV